MQSVAAFKNPSKLDEDVYNTTKKIQHLLRSRQLIGTRDNITPVIETMHLPNDIETEQKSEVIVIDDDDTSQDTTRDNKSDMHHIIVGPKVKSMTNPVEAALGRDNYYTVLSGICEHTNLRKREKFLRALFSCQKNFRVVGTQTVQESPVENVEVQNNVLKPDSDGFLPIHRAVLDNSSKIHEFAAALVSAGKLIDQRTTCPNRFSPLHLAILSDCPNAMISALLELGCSPHCTDAKGRNALHMGLVSDSSQPLALITEVMAHYGQDLMAAVTSFDIDGYTPIMRGVALNKVEHLKIMLEALSHENARKFAVNLVNPINGRTALNLLIKEPGKRLTTSELACRRILQLHGAVVKINPFIDKCNNKVKIVKPKIFNIPVKSLRSKPPNPKISNKPVNKIVTGDGELTLSGGSLHGLPEPLKVVVKDMPQPQKSVSRQKINVDTLLQSNVVSETPRYENVIVETLPTFNPSSPDSRFILKGDGKKKRSSEISKPMNLTLIVPEKLKDTSLFTKQAHTESDWINCTVTKVAAGNDSNKNVDIEPGEISHEDLVSPVTVGNQPDLSKLMLTPEKNTPNGLDFITDDEHDTPYIGSLVEIPYTEETESSQELESPRLADVSVGSDQVKTSQICSHENGIMSGGNTPPVKVQSTPVSSNKRKTSKSNRTVSSAKKRRSNKKGDFQVLPDVGAISNNDVEEDLVLQLSVSSNDSREINSLKISQSKASPVKWKDQIMRKHTTQMCLHDDILNNPAMQPKVLLRRIKV